MTNALESVSVFEWPIRVYYEDTDAQGIVYFANYLRYFERARTEWLRHLEVDQNLLREQHDRQFVVADTKLKYRVPARFDEMLLATVEPLERKRASFLLRQRLLANNAEQTLLVDSQTRVACVRASDMRPAGIPSFIKV